MKRIHTRRTAVVLAGVALALGIPAAGLAAGIVEVGQTANTPAPSCPENCQAIGRVTGFQIRQGAATNPYRMRSYGKVVAFSIALGKPSADQTKFFTDRFGGASTARLSVLRPARGARNKYVLTGQSQVVNLTRYFGSTPTFAIQRALTIKPTYTIALTVPTWVPAFSVGLADGEQWRSSRDPRKCDDVSQDAAQQRLGGSRTYGCIYKTARLRYTAFYVQDAKPTSK